MTEQGCPYCRKFAREGWIMNVKMIAATRYMVCLPDSEQFNGIYTARYCPICGNRVNKQEEE